ncbi:MAG: RlmE family RNA methyltransferase [Deltaproteobacteria bacterium]|nr:RlmE family RNA methyltransferase [Deltaproteobacteria bacterium]
MGSKLGDRDRRHDAYWRRAKQEGLAARAAFKLEEIDQRHHVLRAGARVLDLGCAPGSWLQYAARVVGAKGALVGIDRNPLEVSIPGARLMVGDIYQTPLEALRGDLAAFDAVLSDMAPDTTGVRQTDQARSEALFEHALGLAEALLAPGGHFVGKIFQGGGFQQLVQRCRASFEEVKIVKPKSSRKESIEVFVVGLRRKPAAQPTPPPARP